MFTRARIRLALFYAGALAAILVAVGGTAYFVLRRELDNEINGSLSDSLAALRASPSVLTGEQVRPNGNNGSDDDHHDDDHRQPPSSVSTDVFFLLLDAQGNVASNPRNVDTDHFPLARLVSTRPGSQSWTGFSDGDHHYRVVSFGRGDGTTLAVGRSLDARDYQLRALAIVLVAGGGAGVLLAAVGGFWLAGRALVPIRRSLETQRRFVSDASHELRTPIAVMKANAEL
ncbi:MAG: hypothetical protein IT304_00685, partial [Dehalococcoidia bacterium]|nr:hypothetical protein [Dehalococcoidia bacterium]